MHALPVKYPIPSTALDIRFLTKAFSRHIYRSRAQVRCKRANRIDMALSTPWGTSAEDRDHKFRSGGVTRPLASVVWYMTLTS